jgi:hypothetical protein
MCAQDVMASRAGMKRCDQHRKGAAFAPSLPSSSFYDIDSGPDSGFYIQMCGIEQVCIGGRL